MTILGVKSVLRQAISVAAALSLAGAVLAAPAQADDPGVSVRSNSSGLCLENRSGTAAAGNSVQLAACSESRAQTWIAASDGTARVQGFCVQPVGGTVVSGRGLQIANCTGATAQRWDLPADGSIRTRTGGLCVAVVSGAPRLQRCAITTSQRWTFVPRPAAPTTTTPTTPTQPVPQQPSGAAMPVGDLPGWRHIFADDFTKDAATGSWANDCSPDAIVYAGAQGQKWRTYPKCWNDTYQKRPYRSDAVLSVRNGVLNFHLRRVDGIPAGANPSPLITGTSQYQTYGRYSARMRVTNPVMNEYYVAWLLWPQSERWPYDGEFDFPEGQLGGTATGFHHFAGAGSCVGCQVQSADVGARFTDWHTYTIEWSPGRIRYLLDGAVVLDSTVFVPSGPMRWQLQTETNGNGTSDGNLEVDWVSVWAHRA